MIVTYEKPENLKPYQNNNKYHSDDQILRVASSIQEFGWTQPVVVDKNKVIIVGHARVLASLKLKLKTIPIIVADHLSENEVIAARIADNKSSSTEYNNDAIKFDLGILNRANYNINLTAIEPIELDFLMKNNVIDDNFQRSVIGDFQNNGLSAPNPVVGEVKNIPVSIEGEDDVPEEAPSISKPGNIFKLGEHRLMCGDATDEESVLKLMNGDLAKMIFTDPPYGVDYKGINNDSRKGLKELLNKAFFNYSKSVIKGSSIYCFHSDRCADIFHEEFRKFFHFSSMIIWVKPSLVMGQSDYQSRHEPCFYGWEISSTHKWHSDRKQTSIIECGRDKIEGHTTPKPVYFIERCLNNSSVVGDIVLDLFGGSGSTLIACHKSERKCYMMELDPKYFYVIIARWEKFTGLKPELII